MSPVNGWCSFRVRSRYWCMKFPDNLTMIPSPIHWWASDAMTQFSKSDEETNAFTAWMAWVHFQQITIFMWTVPLMQTDWLLFNEEVCIKRHDLHCYYSLPMKAKMLPQDSQAFHQLILDFHNLVANRKRFHSRITRFSRSVLFSLTYITYCISIKPNQKWIIISYTDVTRCNVTLWSKSV